MTIATITIEHQGKELAAGARSYLYRMLATAFSYPTNEFCESLASGEWPRQLFALAQHLPCELSTPTEELPGGVASREFLQESYVSIFEVGTGQPYCPLYEGSHRSGRMKLMEDLVRFYEHFGLITQPGDHPDHLSAELEFMHYMAFKEAAALAHADPVPDVQRAQRDFLDRHLCKWLPRVRERLRSAQDLPPFYLFAAGLAEEFCRRDLAWLKAA
jgi:DMSO reductase family type II enzyme chaperone